MNSNNYKSLLWSLSLLTIAIHLAANATGGYGIFRDELYYIACANHPDIGYVDHPPLSIWILSVWKFLFGNSLFSIRFLPAICGGLTTFIIGTLTKNFGGEKYAMILACLSSMFAPIFLAFFGLFTMNAFDILLWSLVFLVLQKISQSVEPKYWFLLGFILGLGALNKISMLWLCAGIVAGILLTSHRSVLRTAVPWIAGSVAALIFLPFIVWNFTHDFAHLEFIHNASSGKYASQNSFTFFVGLLQLINPLALPLWLAGFWFLLTRRVFRLIGIAVMVVLVILLVNVHSKAEYFAAAMTVLLPAGAVQLEQFFKKYFGWMRVPYAVALTAAGIVLLPMTIDILPVESFLKYQSALGISPPSTEGHRLTGLPQHYADRFGWKNIAEVVTQVYRSLPDSEKQNCLIYGRNYGEAAAVDYFGRNLPPVVSQHNSYWYWSLKYLKQDITLIVVGVPKDELSRSFEDVQEAAIIHSFYAMPYESHLPVSICKKPRRPVLEIWKDGKLFI